MTAKTTKRNIPVAVQLYSLRHDCKRDFPGTLKAVARMGYDGVEFAGYWNTSAADLRKMLDDLGLKAAGTHIGIETLEGDQFQQTIDFNRTIGNDFLIVPGLPAERTVSAESWARAARQLEDVAAKVAPLGMWVGCHCHKPEFADFGGRRAWDILYGTTKRVVMQIDTGNALFAGVEPLAFMKKYPGRQQSTHLKEFSATKKWPLLGDGDVNWDGVLDFCASAGDTRWYVIEFENEAYPALESVEKCLAFVRAKLR